MSLISDALRKTRQEAAERDARSRGLAPPPGPVTGTSSSGLGTGLVLGAVIAAMAALAGGTAVWWAVGSDRGAGPQESARIEPTASLATEAPDGVPDGRASGAPAPEVETRVDPVSEPAAPDTTSPSPREDDQTTPAAAGAFPAAPPHAEPMSGQPPAPAPAARQVRPETVAPDDGPRDFGLVADLGYARLELGYLIYRSDDPFAEINGAEVHVGSRVDGFMVEEITRTSIRLSDDRGPVTLRIR